MTRGRPYGDRRLPSRRSVDRDLPEITARVEWPADAVARGAWETHVMAHIHGATWDHNWHQEQETDGT